MRGRLVFADVAGGDAGQVRHVRELVVLALAAVRLEERVARDQLVQFVREVERGHLQQAHRVL